MKFSYGSEHTILIVNLKNNWTSFTYISVEVSYDAITYIKKLQDEGRSLTQMLQAMEVKEKSEERETPKIDELFAIVEMKFFFFGQMNTCL